MRHRASAHRVARAVALFLLSLNATGNTMLAWSPADASHLLPAALVLAAATAIGLAIEGWLAGLIDGTLRARIRLAAWIPYSGLLALASLRLTSANASESADVAWIFVILQPVFIVLGGLGRGHIGALLNALMLTVFASTLGGVPAATAVTGYVVFLVAFLVFDHTARKLAAYPGEAGPGVGATVLRACGVAMPVVLAMALVFWVWPPTGHTRLLRQSTGRQVSHDQLRSAYRDLLLIGAVAAAMASMVFYFALRLRGGGGGAAAVQVVDAKVHDEEIVAPPAKRGTVAYSGLRGKIVRTYMRFVRKAARVGLRRRNDMTAAEFAERVGDVPSVTVLTDAFTRARYGPDEPVDADLLVAQRAGNEAATALREKRG
jgi:uncharacterized protein DUF4129